MRSNKKIVEDILNELKSRKGFDVFWNDIDRNIKKEIKEALIKILPN